MVFSARSGDFSSLSARAKILPPAKDGARKAASPWNTAKRCMECSAEGEITGDGQNEDSPLGYGKRHPDFVIKLFHGQI
jgi:hypothetical protein